jgi:hypothetical protein
MKALMTLAVMLTSECFPADAANERTFVGVGAKM